MFKTNHPRPSGAAVLLTRDFTLLSLRIVSCLHIPRQKRLDALSSVVEDINFSGRKHPPVESAFVFVLLLKLISRPNCEFFFRHS